MPKYMFFNLILMLSILFMSLNTGVQTISSHSLILNDYTFERELTTPYNVSLIYTNQYHTPSELQDELENMLASAPNLIEMFTIGQSIQGREIYCLKITNKLDTRPKANSLIVSQHHSREQITVEAALRFILHLINNYGLDANITDFVDNQDIYVIPTLNPDGLYHVLGNESVLKPNEWLRKNLRAFDDDNDGLFDEDSPEDVNGDGIISSFDVYLKDIERNTWIYSYEYLEGIDNDGDGLVNEDPIGGVDLNRNYDYRWNDSTCDTGASSNTLEETFPGTAPFSEPETQAYRDFVEKYSFATAISLHSGINTTYFPWASSYGYAEPTLYYNIYNDIQKILPDRFTSVIHNGGASNLRAAYTCAGEWGDWMYARGNCLVPMTFEIFHKAGSDQYSELIVENDTHKIYRWDGMRDYFAPSEDKIEDLWIDIYPVFEYWLYNTPTLDLYVKSAQGSYTTSSIITIKLAIRNLSPRINTIKEINVLSESFTPLTKNEVPISFSKISPKDSIDVSFDVVIDNEAFERGNLTIMVGNDYTGYYPLTISQENVTKRTNFDFGFLLLVIPLLVYKRKKNK